MSDDARLPVAEVQGIGSVLYRCERCGEMMNPQESVIRDEKSYHPDHAPEENEDGR